jgi:serine protease Do
MALHDSLCHGIITGGPDSLCWIEVTRFPMPARLLPAVLLSLSMLSLLVLASARPAPAAEAPLEQALGALFTVHTADAEDRFLGSAFLWGDGSVAVTNAHVVGDASEVRLTDARGREEIGLVIGRDAVRDVAVISVAAGRQGLALGAAPALGAEVWALGAPLGIEFTVTEGRVSALGRQVEAAVPILMLQHDAAVNPGSSGGPLVDAAGVLVGMNSQIADGSRMFVGIAYAIPADDLSRIVAGLIDETLLPLPELGLTARPVDRQLAAALGIAASGLLVDSVTDGSLAALGGLRAGDVVLALGGHVLAKPGDLAFAVEAALPDGLADVAVLRAGEKLLLSVPLVADDVASNLSLRDVSGAVPQRVVRYTLETLGMVLGADGLVTAVNENSPALFGGVAAGDRIVAVNGALADLSAVTIEAPVLLLLQGETGATRHVLIDPWATGKTIRPVGGANVLDPDVVVF